MVFALLAALALTALTAVAAWCLLSENGRDVARYVLIAVMRLFN